MSSPRFARYIGIDYSGAATPEAHLTGIRVYLATPSRAPREVLPPATATRSKLWSRRDLGNWLIEMLLNGPPTLVGIDHGFSFPLEYFEAHQISLDWDVFLADLTQYWPTHQSGVTVEAIRKGDIGSGAARSGSSRWRRIVEARCKAKSVFHFDVQGSVAKSTHAGLPWIWQLRCESRGSVHFWPFDGWSPPFGKSVVCEIYPSLYAKAMPVDGRNPHQQDAWATAMWLRSSDRSGRLDSAFKPKIPAALNTRARIEGWILGVDPPTESPQGCT